jgi:hypothetical protein
MIISGTTLPTTDGKTDRFKDPVTLTFAKCIKIKRGYLLVITSQYVKYKDLG